MRIFDLDSPLMRFLTKVADLIIINIIMTICCIPIFTIGPAVTAAHYVCLKMVRNEDCYIVRSYFKSFKQNFKQATLIWLIILGLSLILVGDLYIMSKVDMQLDKPIKYALCAIGVVIFLILIYVFPTLAKFDNTIWATIKNAFLMALLQLPKTILMVVLYAAPALISIYFYQVIPVMMLLGISGPIFLSAMLYNKFFQKIEDNMQESQAGSEENQEEEEDPDRIFSDKLDETLVGKNMDFK